MAATVRRKLVRAAMCAIDLRRRPPDETARPPGLVQALASLQRPPVPRTLRFITVKRINPRVGDTVRALVDRDGRSRKLRLVASAPPRRAAPLSLRHPRNPERRSCLRGRSPVSSRSPPPRRRTARVPSSAPRPKERPAGALRDPSLRRELREQMALVGKTDNTGLPPVSARALRSSGTRRRRA